MASRHSSSRSASCGQGEIRWHGVQDDPGTVELRASLPTLPAGERHILVDDADRRRRVGSAVRLRRLVAQTAHPRCAWVTSPVAVSDPNSFEDGALGPLESDAERGMERGEQEPMNALMSYVSMTYKIFTSETVAAQLRKRLGRESPSRGVAGPGLAGPGRHRARADRTRS